MVVEWGTTQYFSLEVTEFFETGLSAVTQMITLDLRHDLLAMIRIKGCEGLRLDVDGFDENAVEIKDNCVQTVQIHKAVVVG